MWPIGFYLNSTFDLTLGGQDVWCVCVKGIKFVYNSTFTGEILDTRSPKDFFSIGGVLIYHKVNLRPPKIQWQRIFLKKWENKAVYISDFNCIFFKAGWDLATNPSYKIIYILAFSYICQPPKQQVPSATGWSERAWLWLFGSSFPLDFGVHSPSQMSMLSSVIYLWDLYFTFYLYKHISSFHIPCYYISKCFAHFFFVVQEHSPSWVLWVAQAGQWSFLSYTQKVSSVISFRPFFLVAISTTKRSKTSSQIPFCNSIWFLAEPIYLFSFFSFSKAIQTQERPICISQISQWHFSKL